MQQALEAVPGVEEVQPVRSVRVQYRGLPLLIVAIDEAKVGRRVQRHVIEGDVATMDRLAAAGQGVIVAENLAALLKLKVGDPFELAAPNGMLRLPVVGVIRDLSNQLGTVFSTGRCTSALSATIRSTSFASTRSPASAARNCAAASSNGSASSGTCSCMLNAEVRKFVGDLMDQWFGMTYLQMLVAVSVAVLGIVNTLTVSITDRRRELGVLRAVGGLRSQIRQTVWMEAVTIGLIGLILGLVTGAMNLYYELQVVQVDLTGIPLQLPFPVRRSRCCWCP